MFRVYPFLVWCYNSLFLSPIFYFIFCLGIGEIALQAFILPHMFLSDRFSVYICHSCFILSCGLCSKVCPFWFLFPCRVCFFAQNLKEYEILFTLVSSCCLTCSLRERPQIEHLVRYIVEEAPEDAEKTRTFKYVWRYQPVSKAVVLLFYQAWLHIMELFLDCCVGFLSLHVKFLHAKLMWYSKR